ncbi:MAG: rRNA pseudouridine synthase [Planctomycetia bacterium]|nr:rRNA pseudouridine synthase [Planctomycetia bacterium]
MSRRNRHSRFGPPGRAEEDSRGGEIPRFRRNPKSKIQNRKSPRRRHRAATEESPAEPLERQPRLQKVLAAAGLGSRRACEELIESGRVEIDRQVVTELGTRVDPLRNEIRVDGEALKRPRKTYYLVHKPQGVIATSKDPSGRERVIDLVPPVPRVFPVGRLDASSEGLIVCTNDGELANRLTHPRYGVEKLYHVLVAGPMTPDELNKLRQGMHLVEGFARVSRVSIRSVRPHSTWLEMVLDEGRNREIRRLLAKIGHKVLRLRRVAIGSLRLADMPAGSYREIHPQELAELRLAVRTDAHPRRELRSRTRRQGTTVPRTDRKGPTGPRTSGRPQGSIIADAEE